METRDETVARLRREIAETEVDIRRREELRRSGREPQMWQIPEPEPRKKESPIMDALAQRQWISDLVASLVDTKLAGMGEGTGAALAAAKKEICGEVMAVLSKGFAPVIKAFVASELAPLLRRLDDLENRLGEMDSRAAAGIRRVA
jgi:hypothetical protein